MNIHDIDTDDLATMPAQDLISFALANFKDRCAIGTSLQKSGIAIIDLASRISKSFRVFFVDTVKNHPETYQLLDEVQRRYGIQIEVFKPDPEDIRYLQETYGQWPHFFSRVTCCKLLKERPHQKALESLDVWITGIRSDQSHHREATSTKAKWIKTDSGRPVLKLSPLVDWAEQEVDRYAEENRLPHNRLYDYVSPMGERYQVIGCACCHVPIRPGLEGRMGKFPWEQGPKECGIHLGGTGI